MGALESTITATISGRRSSSRRVTLRATPFSTTAASSGTRPPTAAPFESVIHTSRVFTSAGEEAWSKRAAARAIILCSTIGGRLDRRQRDGGFRIAKGFALTVTPRRAIVITVSDSAASGTKPDVSGPEACRLLREAGLEVEGPIVVADERTKIAALLRDASQRSALV